MMKVAVYLAAASPTQGWGSPPFASAESLTLMWQYVRYFISAYMPIIMIVVAVFAAWGIAALISSLFTKEKDDDEDNPVDYL